MQTILAVFARRDRADSAVGRLEVAGIAAESISMTQDPVAGPRHDPTDILVTATVDEDHVDKAVAILSVDGRIEIVPSKEAK